MIHIALNHYSRKGLNKPWEENCKPSRLYTAPGLGDRVTCLWGYTNTVEKKEQVFH